MLPHLQISLRTKFHVQVTILIFWTTLLLKLFCWFKTEDLRITIKLRIFELVEIPNFRLQPQFSYFRPSLPQSGISGL